MTTGLSNLRNSRHLFKGSLSMGNVLLLLSMALLALDDASKTYVPDL